MTARSQRDTTIEPSHPVRLIFLGGLAEVGKNLLVVEHGDDRIVIDCGIGFPAEDQFGIDLVLPDISYLRERAGCLRGIFLTHGHEDHIGALPYLLPVLQAPVYATPLTMGLVGAKLTEARLSATARLCVFDPDEHPAIPAGVFTVEPFRVCHSIPDAVGFGIDTPAGLIVVTGDFKFDETPIDGRLTDYDTLRRFGDRGVHLLVSDCVHIESDGRTPSERTVGDTYDELFGQAPGRIIIATFASQIARIQQVIDTAARHGRKVVTLGRSLENNVRVVSELGYLSDPGQTLIEPRLAAQLPDDEVVYIVTGSQGEPMAVLSRVASGDHREIAVGPGDTVVISATPIPGNETSVARIINQLFRRGAEVIYGNRANVHVSGHASRDELAHMIELTQPRHVLPTHGEYRHMALYADLAQEQGISAERITLAEVGDIIEVTPEAVSRTGSVEADSIYISAGTAGTVSDLVLRDRQALAREGIVIVAITIDRQTGHLITGPHIITRGFIHTATGRDLLNATKAHLRDLLTEEDDATTHSRDVSGQLHNATAAYLYRETRRRPIILPIVLER